MAENPEAPRSLEEDRPGELHTHLCLLAWMLGGAVQGVVASFLLMGLLMGLCELLPFCRDLLATWIVLVACALAFVVGFVLFGYELVALDRALSKRRRERATTRGESTASGQIASKNTSAQ